MPPPARRYDPLLIAATVLFVLAVGLAAIPAFRTGSTLPSMLLLVGLAAVAFAALLALRLARGPAEAGPTLSIDAVLAALAEPAAIAAADGRILQVNPAWTSAGGPQKRLPQGANLFVALNAASRGEPAAAWLDFIDGAHQVTPAALGENAFLLRVILQPAAPAAAPLEAEIIEAPTSLDAFAIAAPFGAALLDGDEVFAATVLEANAALRAMGGGEKPIGRPFGELIDPGSRIDAGLGVSEGRSGPFEVRLAHDRTHIAHLYLTRTAGRLVAYLLDVTAQKQIELQLAQAQKMQAIGQLAGGVAHDFNNLLTAIRLRIDELTQAHPVGDPSYEALAEINQISMRAADLVRKLLAFSRKQTVQRESLELGELIGETEVMLRRLLPEHVRLTAEYGRDLPTVRADKSQIEMVVMNLTVNARDAIREAGVQNGEVHIKTARVILAEAQGLGYAGPPREALAMLEVSDNGPGIPPEVMDKIFEPFFTTKPVGEGTGLGLATVYGIVKQSDGWIAVSNKPGSGAAFRIFLPIHHAPPAPPKAIAPARPAPRDLSGAGRILFVEDEDVVRGVAARLLRARGYEVLEAASGEDALELCKEHAGTIDLMISDVVMPGIDGPTLLKKARDYLGQAPVMFISGYAEAEFSDLLEGEGSISFLPKPLDIKTLAERVKQQLRPAA
ncbi:MAG: integral rane sensor hybrid histidine kinase [Caulobacteraceae bacterium]|nr:integral rane sensor hybrid histidine kinase [Caulobacteraceae bacterium]